MTLAATLLCLVLVTPERYTIAVHASLSFINNVLEFDERVANNAYSQALTGRWARYRSGAWYDAK